MHIEETDLVTTLLAFGGHLAGDQWLKWTRWIR
jgi:hypothetical protein